MIGNSRKLFIRSLLVGTCISILVFFLSMAGYLRKWENGIFDFLMWWETEKRSSEIFLIEIDGADYKSVFNSTSPLSRKALADVIRKLSMSKPKAIGIDISIKDETSEDEYLLSVIQKLNRDKIPIVFPLPTDYGESGANQSPETTLSQAYPLFRFVNSQSVFFGAIDFPESSDGIIREMPLMKITNIKDDWPSFPLSLAAAGDSLTWQDFLNEIRLGAIGRSGVDSNLKKIRSLINSGRHMPFQKIHFIGDRKSFNSLKFSQVSLIPDESFKPGSIFTDKIVLIGGVFEDSRDFHMTPKGMMYGVEIIANSLETLLHANPIRPVNHILELLFELILVLVLSYFFFRFSPLKASMLSFISIIPLGVVSSALAFSNFSRWLNFVPAGLSVLIHGRISRFEHYSKLKHENIELVHRLDEKNKEIARLKKVNQRKRRK